MRGAAFFAAATALIATSASAETDPRTPGVVAAVRGELGASGLAPDARFAIAFSDLNDDHHDEAVVHLVDAGHCGSGGCTTFVMTETEVGWLQVGRMSVSRLPIYRLPEHHGGWFDLGVYVSGGGTRPGLRAVRFERGKYKSNPSTGMMVARVPQQATLVLPPNSEMIPAAAQ